MISQISIKSLLKKTLLVLPLIFSVSAFAETCPIVDKSQISNGTYNVAPYSGTVPPETPNVYITEVSRIVAGASVTPEKTQLTTCIYNVKYLNNTNAYLTLSRNPNSPMTFSDSSEWYVVSTSGPQVERSCIMSNTSGNKCSFTIGDDVPSQPITASPFGATKKR